LSAGRDEDWGALKLGDYWNLRRFVPPEKRPEVIRAARQPLPTGGRCYDVGEFRNWEQLELKYRQLAEELGHAGKIPAPGESNFSTGWSILTMSVIPAASARAIIFF
jgi:hypothetical protein